MLVYAILTRDRMAGEKREDEAPRPFEAASRG
jgi:hypothetical protein